MGKIVVDVMLKPEILDPQGKAVAAALPRLGFSFATDVRQGKRFEITVDGDVTAAQIAEVLGDMPATPDRAAPRVSGSLDAHYAPNTPLALVTTEQLPELMQRLSARGRRFALMYHTQGQTNSEAAVRLPLSADPQAYAHALYATLRMLDM